MANPTLPTKIGSNENSELEALLVLACGYRTIRIPKTGATFPAFLVRLPGQPEGVWRSKRDFLLLGRVQSSISLPKAALKKLADLSPWRRPSLDRIRDSNNPTDDNNYHVRMKKSLMQLDQFLRGVAKCETDVAFEAWERFCRPGDTDGLVSVEHKLKKDAFESTGANSSNQTSALKSSKLGQYFASRDNAKQVVSWVIDKCTQTLETGSPIMFLEPSCGHGDIVEELVRQLDSMNAPQNQVSILCFDIDNNALRECRKKLETCQYSINYTCQNFLETKCKSQDDSYPAVFCLGGPPYTTGAGSQQKIQRDLPTLFIRHCIMEYRAQALCFLLPNRYKRTRHTEEGYQQEILDLKSSTFFFQGKVPVTQPSIIQCFERKA